jgi:hypothetical protein
MAMLDDAVCLWCEPEAGYDAGRRDSAARRSQFQYRRSAPERQPSSSDRLRELARRVERLPLGGRTDPEQIVLGKLAIAGELRELARAIGP